jgi:hypothetical protein
VTATGVPAIIEDLLLTRATLMATQGPALPVALPDAAFTVPTSGKYLEVRHLPNQPAWQSLASDGPTVEQGILNIIVHWKKTQGSIASKNVVGQVMAFFPKGLMLTSPGIIIKVYRKPWHSQPLIDTDTQTAISIPYQANVAG